MACVQFTSRQSRSVIIVGRYAIRFLTSIETNMSLRIIRLGSILFTVGLFLYSSLSSIGSEPSIETLSFGKLPNGDEVKKFTLRNGRGIEAYVV